MSFLWDGAVSCRVGFICLSPGSEAPESICMAQLSPCGLVLSSGSFEY